MDAKKSLGQNFLKNPVILRKMADKTKEILTREQKHSKKPIQILEIGPGKGALTEYLQALGHPMLAIETDDRLIPILQETFKKPIKNKLFKLIHQDIRLFDPTSIKGPYVIVANIPYYLTGYIFKHFLESDHQPLAMITMVQKEVAKRMIDKKQSLLSLCAKTYGQPSVLTHVSKGNFTPMPNVDSSVLVIDHISKDIFAAHPTLEKKYWQIAKKAFNSKRKQLGGTVLKGLMHSFAKKRAEELSVKDWIRVTSDMHAENM